MNDSDAIVTETRSSLACMISPKSVALIGATDREGTVGRTVLENLCDGAFRGNVYPVNPKRAEVLGRRAYVRISDVPEKVNLAVVVPLATAVPGIVGECVDAGVHAAVVISAGFKELGAEHCHLHGIGRRCPLFSLRSSPGRDAQTHHCDQSGPDCGSIEGGELAYRSADGKLRAAFEL
jgi:predicted CoA-binding protein